MQLTNSKKTHAGIIDCVGNTPLVHLSRLFPGSKINLYGKLEMFNPGGSIKDRTALNILLRAIEKKEVDSATTIIESTSGNMGVGLARTCHYLGIRLILVTDPHLNVLTEKILRTFKAEIVRVDKQDTNGGYLNTRLDQVKTLLAGISNSFWPDQYHNQDNPCAHEQTFLEINDALHRAPDYLFVATSTCGTLRGIADSIEKHRVHTKLIAVDAEGSVIFGSQPRARLIPGMGASRPSDFLNINQIHDVMHISDQESVAGCHKLLHTESILAGGSSGAIVRAIEKQLLSLPDHSTVVALFADNGERYLDTIYSDEWYHRCFSNRISV